MLQIQEHEVAIFKEVELQKYKHTLSQFISEHYPELIRDQPNSIIDEHVDEAIKNNIDCEDSIALIVISVLIAPLMYQKHKHKLIHFQESNNSDIDKQNFLEKFCEFILEK